MFVTTIYIDCTDDTRQGYLDVRKNQVDPAVSAAPGFVKLELLENVKDANKLLLHLYWQSEDHASAWRISQLHDEVNLAAKKVLKVLPGHADYKLLYERAGG